MAATGGEDQPDRNDPNDPGFFPDYVKEWVRDNPDFVQQWMSDPEYRGQVLEDPSGVLGDSRVADWVQRRVESRGGVSKYIDQQADGMWPIVAM